MQHGICFTWGGGEEVPTALGRIFYDTFVKSVVFPPLLLVNCPRRNLRDVSTGQLKSVAMEISARIGSRLWMRAKKAEGEAQRERNMSIRQR
jgi:hypothetical protein